MEMVKNHNLDSHKKLRQDPSSSLSELPLDLLSSVFKRLGFADFQRGKLVCSSWYAASRQSKPKNNTVPWLILFTEQNNNNNCCMLFNPDEKDRLYKTQDLSVEFGKSVCVATYGNWLWMRDPLYNLYIVNLFMHERINLPPVESQLGSTMIGRSLNGWFSIYSHNGGLRTTRDIVTSPVFWVDEKTKSYVVLWKFRGGSEDMCVVYSKNGDTSWNQIPQTYYCFDMVYNDHKLYLLSSSFTLGIIDFSEETPRQTIHQCPDIRHFDHGHTFPNLTKFVVTVTGDILKVRKMLRTESRTDSFCIFKVYSQGLFQKCERIYSLGDEAMLFDIGITVVVNDLEEGFKRNSIYFNNGHGKNPNEIFIFDLKTQKSEQLHKFDFSSVQLSTAQWFVPSFKQKYD